MDELFATLSRSLSLGSVCEQYCLPLFFVNERGRREKVQVKVTKFESTFSLSLSVSVHFFTHSLFTFFNRGKRLTPVHSYSFLRTSNSPRMHWLSFISILLIISLCGAQSGSPFKSGESANDNRGGTFHVVSGGNGASASGSQNGADGSVRVVPGNTLTGSFGKPENNGQSSFKAIGNGGNSIPYSLVFPLIIGAFIALAHI